VFEWFAYDAAVDQIREVVGVGRGFGEELGFVFREDAACGAECGDDGCHGRFPREEGAQWAVSGERGNWSGCGKHNAWVVILRTARLVLRRLTWAAVDSLVELDGDPEVMRFLTKGLPTPREVVVGEVLPRLLAEYDSGFGRWAAIEGGVFVGWLGLRPGGELGYRLRRAVWGRGLATELGVPRVWARTMSVNVASRRVMAKAGLRHVRTWHEVFDDPIDGTELGEVEYAVTRAEWVSGLRRESRGVRGGGVEQVGADGVVEADGVEGVGG
jgi:RimJ/RimL family protein N-acetyltransferase